MNIAVLFDMDGVIVDSNPHHKLAFDVFFKKYNVSLTEDELKTHVYGRINKEIMAYLFKDRFTPELGEMWADEKEAMFREIYLEDIEPVPGVIAFLQMLRTNGIKVAVGTSAPKANLDFVLDQLDIRGYFDALLHSADVTIGKPAPDIYLKAAAKLNMEPDRCVVIEDSLAGVQAGLNAGMKVVGITTTHTAEELSNTNLIIKDFEGFTSGMLLDLF